MSATTSKNKSVFNGKREAAHLSDQIDWEDNALLERLAHESTRFLKTYGTSYFFGKEFADILWSSKTLGPFENLLYACGFDQDITGFFKTLFERIKHGQNNNIAIKKVPIPLLYLFHILEVILPGHRTFSIKCIQDLEQKAFVTVNKEEKSALQEVMDTYPVRLSAHVIRQAMVSDKVKAQYFPFKEELDATGHVITFEGHLKNGILEQMYQNRAVLLLDMRCPVYCRFCFRKHKSIRNKKTPGMGDVKSALAYVREKDKVEEILITGGEPLLNRPNLETAIKGLTKIDHVKTIRLATRTIFYHPQFFLSGNQEVIHYLIAKKLACESLGKQLEIGIHIVHPHEISVKSLEIITMLVKAGIPVYVQTPFLKNLNDDGRVLSHLFTRLRNAGVKIYYIFTPCSPIHGTQRHWTTIDQAFDAFTYLRANAADRCIPKLCTATPLGKIEWQTSGWAVERDNKDVDYLWIRTPYTRDYFKDFIKKDASLPQYRFNKEGTLDVRFLAKIEDDRLLLGPISVKSTGEHKRFGFNEVKSILPFPRGLGSALSPVFKMPSSHLIRVHKTRVELNLGITQQEFDYLEKAHHITDVVITDEKDPMLSMDRWDEVINRLRHIPHITCVRMRSTQFFEAHDVFTQERIQKLKKFNCLSVAAPFRFEMETWLLHPSQITSAHEVLVKELSHQGINVYANTLLLGQVNDDPYIMTDLAHGLRKANIEFHHLYVAGLECQEKWNVDHPVFSSHVIDIASMIRQQCSGR
ncbi:MAG: radical SAM protein [Desulfobacteraceae bacterium]|nr:radical SAM protein [Desulfobacteraceae bacterium]